MESLQSLEDMRREFERLEAEESEIDRELGELIKQQPNLLIKGMDKLSYGTVRIFLSTADQRLQLCLHVNFFAPGAIEPFYDW